MHHENQNNVNLIFLTARERHANEIFAFVDEAHLTALVSSVSTPYQLSDERIAGHTLSSSSSSVLNASSLTFSDGTITPTRSPPISPRCASASDVEGKGKRVLPSFSPQVSQEQMDTIRRKTDEQKGRERRKRKPKKDFTLSSSIVDVTALNDQENLRGSTTTPLGVEREHGRDSPAVQSLASSVAEQERSVRMCYVLYRILCCAIACGVVGAQFSAL